MNLYFSCISLTRMCDLPDDVVIYILGCCIDPASIKPTVHIAAVCTGWLTLVLSVSGWWTSITVDTENRENIPLDHLFLSRARHKSIDLTLSIRNPDGL